MASSAFASAATPEANPERWRLFIAVELPDALRQALRPPLDELAKIDEIRPSIAEQIHLTLHFLGNVEVAGIPAIKEAIQPVIRRHAGFVLTAQGVDAFGGSRRPKVLWVGFADKSLDKMQALRTDTAKALTNRGFEIEPEFRPHLTLGRVRRPLTKTARQALERWYAAWSSRDFGALPVATVALMRSQLGGGPARHSTIASFELQ